MSWTVAKLADVAPAKPLKVSQINQEETVWQLTLDHIESSSGQLVKKEFMAYSSTGSSTHWFNENHVLYSKIRPYLNKVVLPDQIGIGTTELVPMLVDKSKLDRKYLAYYLRSQKFVDWISSQTAGAKMPRVSMKVFGDHEIPLPPIPEQIRIAEILDKADAIRRKRQQAIQLMDDFLRSVFLDMFGDPVTNPKGWETITLGSCIINGPTNGLYKPSSDYGTGVKILRVDGFYNGKVHHQKVTKRVRVTNKEIEKFSLQNNSIVINRVNSREYLGKCALIENLKEPMLFESNMMNFSVNSDAFNAVFLVSQLSSGYMKNQILKNCKDAVNQSSINQSDIKSFEIRHPPIELQRVFAARVQQVEALKAKLKVSLATAEEQFKALSQRAFTERADAVGLAK